MEYQKVKWIVFLIFIASGSRISQPVFSQSKFPFPENSRYDSNTSMWVTVSGKLAMCSHSDKGSIILTVGGGKPPYSFLWNTNETTQNRSNLNAGTYTVIITDSEGQQYKESIVIQPPFPLVLNPLVKKDASCASSKNGYAKISVKTGRNDYEKDSPPYSVTWSNGLKNVWEADNLAPGTYTVTVGDKYTCETSISFEIQSESKEITVKETIESSSCSGQKNGNILLNVSGGVPPYTYKWNTGYLGKDLIGVSEGIYAVLIQDSKGCTFSGSYSVKSSNPLFLNEQILAPTCKASNNGKIELSITGGIPPYRILWNNGSSIENPENLTEGIYKVKITDLSGCSLEKEFHLKAKSQLEVSVIKVEPVSCLYEADGSISLAMTGAIGDITIYWEDNGSSSPERKNLKSGVYRVRVSDESGCTFSKEIKVEETEIFQAKIESAVEMDCNSGKFKGKAWIEITGGKPPYFVHWIHGNQTTDEIEIFQNSTLKVKIIDSSGCSIEAESQVNIPEPKQISGNSLNFEFRRLTFSSEPEVIINEDLQFESKISSEFISWEWDFGDGQKSFEKNPVHKYKEPGNFTVKLIANDIYGCPTVQESTLSVVDPKELLIIPNAFTPNGDKLNDYFFPKIKGVKEFRLQVFTIWGEVIYVETDPEASGWDGTYKGQFSPPGNYIYRFDFTDKNGNKKTNSGTVSLIR